ncbi:MAG: glycosyltransferase family 2 protein [Clostridia bacterium]|nr:glycosyltransferase family 2 protein [Clostridia bacterium]
MDDLISVIVPVYNIAEYLSRSIGSILNQIYANIEVIAVDDGSKDDSLRVLRELSAVDSRLHVIHQENGGVTKARLTGIQAASGDWIGFVDGDDEIEPDMYEHLLKNAKQYGADISHCGYQMVFPSRVDYYYNTGHLAQQDNRSGLKDLIEGSFIEPGLCNKLFHKTLFHSLLHREAMNDSIKNFEDLLMNFYLFRQAKSSVYEDFCPYHYMIRSGSAATSRVNEHKLRDPLLVLRKIEKETAGDAVLQKAVKGRIAGMLIGQATMNLGDQASLIRPYRAQARKELRRMLPELLHGEYSLRTKLLSAWAGIWPWSYAKIHVVYAKLRGTDKKYEVS